MLTASPPPPPAKCHHQWEKKAVCDSNNVLKWVPYTVHRGDSTKLVTHIVLMVRDTIYHLHDIVVYLFIDEYGEHTGSVVLYFRHS